jgi:glycosyltransferase 2 family protein
MNLLKICGRLFFLLALLFLFIRLFQHFYDIPRLAWGMSGFFSFSLIVTAVCVNVALGAYAWARLLLGGRVFLPFGNAFIIFGQAQVGKYLPGNVLQYVGRVALGRSYGVNWEEAVVSMGIELLLVMTTGSLWGLFGLLLHPNSIPWLMGKVEGRPPLIYGFLFLLIILLAVTLAFIKPVRTWLYQRRAYLHPRRIAGAMLLYSVQFFLFGLLISLLYRALWPGGAPVPWFDFVWGFALAWVVGFVVPGAPGGLGIREVCFVGLFSPGMGEGLAISLAMVLRLVTITGDFLSFGIAYLMARNTKLQSIDN